MQLMHVCMYSGGHTSISSIPVGDADFFFVPRSWHADQFTFLSIYRFFN